MKRILSITLAGLILAGCAGQTLPPKDNDGFYKAAQTHRFGDAVTIVVPRSLSSVASSLEKGGKRCLNQRVVEQSFSPTSYGRSESNYRPQMVRANGMVTLNMLRDGTTGVMDPKGERRMFMAEARAVSGGTQLRMAGPSMNYDDVFKAVAEWSRGQGLRCPRIDV